LYIWKGMFEKEQSIISIYDSACMSVHVMTDTTCQLLRAANRYVNE